MGIGSLLLWSAAIAALANAKGGFTGAVVENTLKTNIGWASAGHFASKERKPTVTSMIEEAAEGIFFALSVFLVFTGDIPFAAGAISVLVWSGNNMTNIETVVQLLVLGWAIGYVYRTIE